MYDYEILWNIQQTVATYVLFVHANVVILLHLRVGETWGNGKGRRGHIFYLIMNDVAMIGKKTHILHINYLIN
jgi:hypothetical protein